MRDFYGCYLLTSKHERGKGRTYIGFTVNPRRRLKQHNGQIVSGARKTSRLRPWVMVLVVYGFATQVQALQFEWAWQHPVASKLVRDIATSLGTRKMGGPKGKVRLLMEMLNVKPWCYYPLTVQFLSSEYHPLRAGCPPLPAHISINTAPLSELVVVVEDDYDEGPCADYDSSASGDEATGLEVEAASVAEEGVQSSAAVEVEGPPGKVKARKWDSCTICQGDIDGHWLACPCGSKSHPECLALHFLQDDPSASMPMKGNCPSCGRSSTWVEALGNAGNIGWNNKHRGRRKADAKKAGKSPSKKGGKSPSKAGVQKAAPKSPAKRGRKPKVAVATADSLADGQAAVLVSPKKRQPKAKAADTGTSAAAADCLADGPLEKPQRKKRVNKVTGGDVAPVTSPAKRRGRPPGSRNKKSLAAGKLSKKRPSPGEACLEKVGGASTSGRIVAAASVEVIDVSDSDDCAEDAARLAALSSPVNSTLPASPENRFEVLDSGGAIAESTAASPSMSPQDLCLRERLLRQPAAHCFEAEAPQSPGWSPADESDDGALGFFPPASPSLSPPLRLGALPTAGCETPAEIRGLQRDVGSMGLGCAGAETLNSTGPETLDQTGPESESGGADIDVEGGHLCCGEGRAGIAVGDAGGVREVSAGACRGLNAASRQKRIRSAAKAKAEGNVASQAHGISAAAVAYTPSPLPLRRRLAYRAEEAAKNAQAAQQLCDVIVLD